jgi:predicted esterase
MALLSCLLFVNELWLSSGLVRLAEALVQIAEAGIPPERTILLGFSQGACLALEFAARNARRYGGVVGLSGALIGPDDTPRNFAGSLDGAPVSSMGTAMKFLRHDEELCDVFLTISLNHPMNPTRYY